MKKKGRGSTNNRNYKGDGKVEQRPGPSKTSIEVLYQSWRQEMEIVVREDKQ